MKPIYLRFIFFKKQLKLLLTNPLSIIAANISRILAYIILSIDNEVYIKN